jgi:hypothetical protein
MGTTVLLGFVNNKRKQIPHDRPHVTMKTVPFLFRLLLLVATAVVVPPQLVFVQAFPTQAGGCHGGEAAVAGWHVANHNSDGNIRLVTTGALSDNDIAFFVDGIEMSSTTTVTTSVLLGVEHTVEIVASQNPFKGALIRVESSHAATFALTPMIHAQQASACTVPNVQGVTHTSNALKNVVSAAFFTPEAGDFVVDVTVVDVNNATHGSVYWYSQYRIRSVPYLLEEQQTVSDPQPPPAPSAAVGRVRTAPVVPSSPAAAHPMSHPKTLLPTVSPFPTYAEKCSVCGDGMRVGKPTMKVKISKEVASCKELEDDGNSGMIPLEMCSIARMAAKEVCGCVATTKLLSADDTMPSPGPARTYAPTVTSLPTATSFPTATAFPTYSEKCHVCGGDVHRAITYFNKVVTVGGIMGTCRDLQHDGKSGLIDPEFCTAAQAVAKANCGCTAVAVTMDSSPSPPTFAPTASAFPTVTAYPTYVEKCNVCGKGKQVTAFDQVIAMDGGVGTCRELENDAATGHLHPSMCADAQAVAAAKCGCAATSNPSPRSAENTFMPTVTPLPYVMDSSWSPPTFAPTVSAFPTVTAHPTYLEKCNVCGKGMRVTAFDQVITMDGGVGTCRELELDAATGHLDPSMCADAQAVAAAKCGCARASRPSPSSAETFMPTVTPIPTVTFSPTYSEKCHVCLPGKHITLPDASVVVDNLVMTCGDLEEAGHEQMIPPKLCLEAQTQAQSVCGCVSNSPVASPVVTFEADSTVTSFPTVTAFPTYSEKCYVCGVHGASITQVHKIVKVGGVMGTCSDLQHDGESGLIDPRLCTKAQAVAKASCECAFVADSSPTPTTFAPTVSAVPTVTSYPTYAKKCNVCGEGMRVTAFDQVITMGGGVGTCRELERDGATGFLDPSMCADAQAMAAAKCGCALANPSPSAETFMPTVTPLPTVTFSPTYSEKCYVCLPGNHTSIQDASVVVDNLAMTCGDLEEAGLKQMIPPKLCPEAQTQAQSVCGCVSNSPVASPVVTFEPTITAYPTTTASPTYAEKCLVCGDRSLKVTNEKTVVTVDGMVLNCGELEKAGATGIMPPRVCPEAMQAAEDSCGCAGAPSGAPTTLSTLEPTTTAYPTITNSPSYSEKCEVCGNAIFHVTNRDAWITIGGIAWSCQTVEEFGATGNLPPDMCSMVQKKAAISCACAPVALEANARVAAPQLPLSSSPMIAPPTSRTASPTTSSSATIARGKLAGLTLLLSTWIL